MKSWNEIRKAATAFSKRFRFYNLEKDNALTEFALKDLRRYVTLFGYMIGADNGGEIREQDPVNRKAADTMPPDLLFAHEKLDALVDKAYGLSPSCTDADRVAHLFKLYAEKVNKA